MTPSLPEPEPRATEQATEDDVLHETVLHRLRPIERVGVIMLWPKFIPTRVTVAPSVVGAFRGRTAVRAGESKENARKIVAPELAKSKPIE